IPSFAKARVSLQSIERLEQNLDSDAAEAFDETVKPLDFNTLSFRDVHFRFDSAIAEEGFDVGPLDLDIKRGEILFVIGGNGAGKTTFLKLLTGLYAPAQGTIAVDGSPIDNARRQSYRELFAAVFGDFHLFTQLYGLGHIEPSQMTALLGELGIAHKTRIKDGALSTVDLSTGNENASPMPSIALPTARFTCSTNSPPIRTRNSAPISTPSFFRA